MEVHTYNDEQTLVVECVVVVCDVGSVNNSSVRKPVLPSGGWSERFNFFVTDVWRTKCDCFYHSIGKHSNTLDHKCCVALVGFHFETQQPRFSSPDLGSCCE